MATVTKPIALDETLQSVNDTLKGIKTAIVNSKTSELTTWREIQTNIRKGLGAELYPAGTKFYIYKYANGTEKTGTPTKYYIDVVGVDKHFLKKHGEATATHSITFQFHELLNESMQFDNAEDQYGLSLDTSVVSWKTYYSDTAGTKVESPTGKPTEQGYYEQNDTSQYPRKTYGSNNWRHSGMRKWLNASPTTAAGAWWTKTTPFDKVPSYSNILPFQALLADAVDSDGCTLLDVVGPVTLNTILNTIKNPDNSDYYLDADANGNYAVASRLGYDTTEDTFYLLSTKEIHCSTYNETDGVLMDYYDKFSDFSSPISAWSSTDTNLYKHKQNSTSSAWWWCRSAGADGARNVMYADGRVDGNVAVYGNGVAPAFTIY